MDSSDSPSLHLDQLGKQVYDQLRAEVMRGDLRPGQRLSVGALARRFGISVTPVRDALRLLASDGLVEVSPRRGTTVSEFTRQNVRESFLARRVLESAAAAKAASVSDDELERLTEIVARFHALRRGDVFEDYPAYIRLDLEFHKRIISLLGSRPLSEFYEKLRWGEQLVQGLSRSSHQRARETVAEHAAILRALQDRDAVSAREAVLNHLQNAEADLLTRTPA